MRGPTCILAIERRHPGSCRHPSARPYPIRYLGRIPLPYRLSRKLGPRGRAHLNPRCHLPYGSSDHPCSSNKLVVKPSISAGACSGTSVHALEPLMAAAGDGWVAVTNRRRAFPDVGSVFTLERPAVESHEGSLCALLVASLTAATARTAWSPWTTRAEGDPGSRPRGCGRRPPRRMLERGADLAQAPTREAFVVFGVDQAVSLRLARSETDGRWRPADDAALETLEVQRFDPVRHKGARIGRRAFLLPDAEFSASSGIRRLVARPRLLTEGAPQNPPDDPAAVRGGARGGLRLGPSNAS